MRIYLVKNYHEVSTPAGVLKVATDWSSKSPRYYVEADEDTLESLKRLGMVGEPQNSDISDALTESEHVPVTKDKAEDVNPPAAKLPESYMCKVHQKEHKKGSSLYAVCFSRNFKPAR